MKVVERTGCVVELLSLLVKRKYSSTFADALIYTSFPIPSFLLRDDYFTDTNSSNDLLFHKASGEACRKYNTICSRYLGFSTLSTKKCQDNLRVQTGLLKVKIGRFPVIRFHYGVRDCILITWLMGEKE